MIDRVRRLPTTLRALRAARALTAHDSWDAERLAAYQRQRLLALIRYAAERSPYYRERFAGTELDDDLDLSVLPTLDKATILEHFDEIVTDPRLTLEGVEAHLRELERERGDALLLGEYRAMATSGTSGRRGVFVYGRDDWTQVLAGFLRWTDAYLGLGLRLPRRRVAGIAADEPLHMTGRMGMGTDVGGHKALRLDARAPLDEMVEALNAHQPEALISYSSVACLLAEEQLHGRLRISPEVVATTSEVRTAEMEERILAAWGRAPFDGYASTETGFIAADCDRHAGLHVFSDVVHVEVVDDDRRPVDAGEPGSRLLVTNLINHAQPLIRVELTDLVTLSSKPCPCGRPYPLIKAIEGRTDDILELPAVRGGTINIHPLTIRSPLAASAAVRDYRVLYERDGLHVEAVLAGPHGGLEEVCTEVQTRLHTALEEHGAQPPPIFVEPVGEIPRHPGSGKRRLVESRVG